MDRVENITYIPDERWERHQEDMKRIKAQREELLKIEDERERRLREVDHLLEEIERVFA